MPKVNVIYDFAPAEKPVVLIEMNHTAFICSECPGLPCVVLGRAMTGIGGDCQNLNKSCDMRASFKEADFGEVIAALSKFAEKEA